MRPTPALILFLSIAMPTMAAGPAALPSPAAPALQRQALTSHQQQLARQFGQRIARNPSYSHIDADWREFIRRQPRHTDINALLAIVKDEATRTNHQNIQDLRRKADGAARQQSTIQRELADARQQRSLSTQISRIRSLEQRQNQLSDMSRLAQRQLQDAQDKQSKMMQTLSSILKNMHDTASSIIQNLK